MASNIGLADSPCFGGYQTQNDLTMLAWSTRRERLRIAPGSELIPWLTNGASAGTGGAQTDQPYVAMYNMLIQTFCSGATGFNMYTDLGTYDMEIWLAMRDAITIVTPFEDVIMDGRPIPSGTITLTLPPTKTKGVALVVSGMVGQQSEEAEIQGGPNSRFILLASSVTPYGFPTGFSVVDPNADNTWRLCDLSSGRFAEASVDGVAEWKSEAEWGSVLLFGASTPCHSEELRSGV
jgi:hypothetical protein